MDNGTKPTLIDSKTYASLAKFLTLWEVRVQIKQAGFYSR